MQRSVYFPTMFRTILVPFIGRRFADRPEMTKYLISVGANIEARSKVDTVATCKDSDLMYLRRSNSEKGRLSLKLFQWDTIE